MIFMHIDQLVNVLAVAQYRSLSLAAEKLFLSKQSLSESVMHLEEEFHIKIFERSHKGMIATPMGKEFLTDAEKLLLFSQQLLAKYAPDPASEHSNLLTMVVFCHLSHMLLPKIVKSLHAQKPGLKIDITDVNSFETVASFLAQQPEAIALVTIHDYDLAYLSQFAYSIFPLINDTVRVLADQSFPLCRQNKIQISDLLDYPLVDNTKYSLSDTVHRFYPDIPLNVELTTGSIETYRRVILEKLAIGFSTVYLTNSYFSPYGDTIKSLPLTDQKHFQMQVALICSNEKTNNMTAFSLAELIKSECL